MSQFVKRTDLEQSARALSDWHFRPGAFERLVPGWERVELAKYEGLTRGSVAEIVLRIGPFPVRWIARHTEVEPGRCFVDEQVRGPFDKFVHAHHFESRGHGSELVDKIDYRLPFGIQNRSVAARLERQFRYRHHITEHDLRAHALWSKEPLTFAITGGTGMIGRALSAFLTTGGHTVKVISRSARGDIQWDPVDTSSAQAAQLAAQLEGVDVIVNLAGDVIAGLRWTEDKRRRILESRVDCTSLIARAVAAMDTPPRVVISASGIGAYGDTGAAVVDERTPLDEPQNFPEEVCRAWEGAIAPVEDLGVRVVNLRIGVVLSLKGGALELMARPFRLGVGGRVGPKDAFMAVIGLDELLDVILHASVEERLSGPLNAVSRVVTQAELAQTMADVLGRPNFFPVPGFVLKALLGKQQAEEMLYTSCRARSKKLADLEHPARHESFKALLRHHLGAS